MSKYDSVLRGLALKWSRAVTDAYRKLASPEQTLEAQLRDDLKPVLEAAEAVANKPLYEDWPSIKALRSALADLRGKEEG